MSKRNKFLDRNFIIAVILFVVAVVIIKLGFSNLFDFSAPMTVDVFMKDLAGLTVVCLITFIPVIVAMELIDRWKANHEK